MSTPDEHKHYLEQLLGRLVDASSGFNVRLMTRDFKNNEEREQIEHAAKVSYGEIEALRWALQRVGGPTEAGPETSSTSGATVAFAGLRERMEPLRDKLRKMLMGAARMAQDADPKFREIGHGLVEMAQDLIAELEQACAKE